MMILENVQLPPMLVAAFQTVGRAYSSFAFASSTVDDDAILYDGVLVTFG